MHEKFITVYDQNVDDIFAYCFSRTHNKELAKIVTKEIFAKTWDGLSEKHTSRQIKVMLYTIAANAVRDDAPENGIRSSYYPALKTC